jgi:glycerol-3-phosphate acyltransferase PlsY
VLELGLKIFLSYIIGSLNGALLIGRLVGAVDIRTQGSGNAGGTNALRTQGKLFALFVILVDIGKGAVPVLFLPSMIIFGVGHDPDVSRTWLTYACGAAAIFGHCFPVWFDFSGGKGAATYLGVLATASPATVLPTVLVWMGMLLLSGYVGLATVIAVLFVPVLLVVTDVDQQLDLILFTVSAALFILYTHRGNLRKLFIGTASRDIGFSLWVKLTRQA